MAKHPDNNPNLWPKSIDERFEPTDYNKTAIDTTTCSAIRSELRRVKREIEDNLEALCDATYTAFVGEQQFSVDACYEAMNAIVKAREGDNSKRVIKEIESMPKRCDALIDPVIEQLKQVKSEQSEMEIETLRRISAIVRAGINIARFSTKGHVLDAVYATHDQGVEINPKKGPSRKTATTNHENELKTNDIDRRYTRYEYAKGKISLETCHKIRTELGHIESEAEKVSKQLPQDLKKFLAAYNVRLGKMFRQMQMISQFRQVEDHPNIDDMIRVSYESSILNFDRIIKEAIGEGILRYSDDAYQDLLKIQDMCLAGINVARLSSDESILTASLALKDKGIEFTPPKKGKGR